MTINYIKDIICNPKTVIKNVNENESKYSIKFYLLSSRSNNGTRFLDIRVFMSQITNISRLTIAFENAVVHLCM